MLEQRERERLLWGHGFDPFGAELTFLAPLWMEQFLQDTFLLSQWSAAPQVRQRSGSHSLTAR